ncbi:MULTISPECIES: ImmA/IrrE family metallo-endopeptidase [unclassified Yoonia]|uniref:ImmA/IrrE family metallo-endopeptidase n=1 Tax=unclassified Yoonia TaxID=2629118 RepID=UPI002AFF2C50|nr:MULTISPECIES: ImmA/IrrE family metallo-endopeptidase [unclassified Yoonia]
MSKEVQCLSTEQKEILSRYSTQRPIQLGKLAKELGVEIKVASLGTGISGQISREGNGYVIRVNRNEARERQRFTIGHELAHFLLHREIIDRSPTGITDTVLYRSGAPQQIEYEANRLAAEIVMPMDLIEQEVRDGFGGMVTEATIEALANRFEVSKAAMEIRLSQLIPA